MKISASVIRPLASCHLILLCLVVGLTSRSSSMSAAEPPSAGDSFATDVLPLLDRYCVECHMEGGAEGGIAFDRFLTQQEAVREGRTWLRVLDALENRIMPPADAIQPAADEVLQILGWIENDFFAAQCGSELESPPVVIRRLNRQEYNNTVRDLTGLDIAPANDFPADEIGFGFDNNGSALNVSPIHVEKYLNAAEQVMDAAIELPDAEPHAPVELIGLRTYPLTAEEPVEFEHHLSPGRYLADFSLVRAGIPESITPPRLEISFGQDRRTVTAVRVQDETVVYRYWLHVVPGDNQVRVALAAGEPAVDGLAFQEAVAANVSGDQRYGGDRGLHVDSMVVKGPVEVAVAQLPASHRHLLSVAPGLGDAGRLEAAQRIITAFAERAFRRPVGESEVRPLLGLYRMAHARGESFERGVQVALTAVLVSPKFLYLVEPDENDENRPLTEFELATRMAYFLWSTMPDDELLDAARHGSLRANLRQQAFRMLDDPKAIELVRNFTGQWLQLRKLSDVNPDAELFPSFSEPLRRAMAAETERFFGWVLSENRSVLELLDADYAFLNADLAQHYGIEGAFGETLQRVSLENRQRGGLLTQASILTLTSNPNRTSPVKRGQWILQQILGTPPPPPPPNVEQLDESPQAAEAASLRERLEIHRSNPECAACHSQMDPLGFALENYDAIGRWRTRDGDYPIDASGELFGGHRFEDAAELKQVLRTSATKKFTRCLIENLLTYALGRGLEPTDYCTVEAIRQDLVNDKYRLRTIVLGVLESDAFQTRGGSR